MSDSRPPGSGQPSSGQPSSRQPSSRQRVTRADGRTINVVQKRGHLTYCFHGCCCGRTDKGYPATDPELYKAEWLRRGLRNTVHLSKGGCLGPCTLYNVAHLMYGGHDYWFHSVNDAWLIRAIFDFTEAMVAADRALPLPPELLEYSFDYYAQPAQTFTAQSFMPLEPEKLDADAQSAELRGLAFLTHADTDLLGLETLRPHLPPDFGPVTGVSLGTLRTDSAMQALLQGPVGAADILAVRVHGRLSGVPGIGLLLSHAKRRGQHLLLLSGTGEPDAEMAAASTVPPRVLEGFQAYVLAGGWPNLLSGMQALSDSLRLTAYAADPPLPLPEHGLYHPNLPENPTLEDWQAFMDPARPTVGVTFYRAHALSGNTAFVDALVTALDEAGANALPVYTSSLKAVQDGLPAAFAYFMDAAGGARIDALINTLSFALAEVNPDGATPAGEGVSALSRLGVPVVQAITSGVGRGPWETSARGLNPLDTAMNVALPEFDGRIISVPISFKERDPLRPEAAARFVPHVERTARAAGIAVRLARLRWLRNEDKRVAFVFTNSAAKASQVGNAVGLDSAASLLDVLHALKADGYDVGELPATSDALMHALLDRTTYDATLLTPAQLEQAAARVPADLYARWFAELPDILQRKMQKQWGAAPGEAYVHDGALALAGLYFGKVFVALQPPRGYGMDPDAIYHTPDLPPTHHYYALYRWLREAPEAGGYGADALVHVGKHGTLEWLPGKGVGLSATCFPDALLGDLPLFYPFIINDPGEGSQAKRRAHATILDHLPPPLTRADTYGPLAELAALVDEYYQLELLDPAKLPLIQGQIWEKVQQANLQTDLGLDVGEMLRRDHGDHVHEWDDEFTADGVPVTISEMNGSDVAHLLEDIDGYLCELGMAQIRDGLHILGCAPAGEQLPEMLRALTRLSNGPVPGMNRGMAALLGLDLDALLDAPGERLESRAELEALAGGPLHTRGDALALLDDLSLHLYQLLAARAFDAASIPEVLALTFGVRDGYGTLPATLEYVCARLEPDLGRTGEEISNLLLGLRGGYVPAGPSGAPSRGMAQILPTGRNFYAVDPRALPSQAAWAVGEGLAREVLARFQGEEGRYPENVAISVWGTSNMRTGGDDVAQILHLLGARPVWNRQTRRIDDVELVPLSELGRPRIDVTVRVSGFFRDAFPHLLSLLDRAAGLAMHAEGEPEELNFPRRHYLADLRERLADLPPEEAELGATRRVFGSAPGSYGAGILDLINAGNWTGDADFAETFVNWGGYAYGAAENGTDARADFRERLTRTELALHNQDNREHDLLDSDDYLQFFGGLMASVRSLSGVQPRGYFGDSANPERARVRDLNEEILRVYRSRVVNPKWLDGIRRHGYKGGLEQTATVDYLFGFDATAQVAHDFMYEGVAESYALDPLNQAFLKESNPWALHAIANRLLEAGQRGLWTPQPQTLEALQHLLAEAEGWLEGRGESPRTESPRAPGTVPVGPGAAGGEHPASD